MSLEKDSKQLDETYQRLNKRAEIIYRFVSLYNDYIYEERDYGTGVQLKMIEIHALTMIEQKPGITATELASNMYKTKGAISQTLKKLVEKGYVLRQYKENDSKTLLLYATEAGKMLSSAHKLYDITEIGQTLQELRSIFADEEIDTFYKVMEQYSELLKSEE